MKNLSEPLFSFCINLPFLLGNTKGHHSKSVSSWFVHLSYHCHFEFYRQPELSSFMVRETSQGKTHFLGNLLTAGKYLNGWDSSNGEGRFSFKSLKRRFRIVSHMVYVASAYVTAEFTHCKFSLL